VKRYIIRPRAPAAAGDPHADTAAVVAALTDAGVAVEPVKSTTESGQHVIKLSADDAGKLAVARPDLIVEEDQPIDLFRVPGLPDIVPLADQAQWQVTVSDPAGAPIPGCTVFAVGPNVGFRADTDADGIAKIEVQPGLVQRLIASPRADFWSRVTPPPPAASDIEIALDQLDAEAFFARIRRLVGVHPGMPTGRGVSVLVIDSGAAPVAGLNVTDGINTLDGADPASWNVDEKGHGTHVSGIIGARPTAAAPYRGIAPDVTLFMAKVFPGGFFSDIIEALDWARTRQIDLVNMSLGGKAPSEAMARAIDQAIEAGVTVVVAAGNDGGPVSFPAVHPDVIAVSAVGRFGSFPADSGHALKVGPHRDWFGGLFSASFTNSGPEIDCCAPGVAIPSTVPQGHAAWDGTSMACPVVTGLLAMAFEAAPWLRTGTRGTRDMVAWLVASGCQPTGMPPAFEGAGLLTAPRLLAAIRSVGG
jgi:subtilisin family serine protease